MQKCLEVGKIINTHGVKGEIKILPLTDDPERFSKLKWVYLNRSGKQQKFDIEDVKYIKNAVILKLKGIDGLDEAETLKGLFLEIDRSDAVKLPDDAYFICDLVGCKVYNEEGSCLGVIKDVLKTGSNDVYLVKREAGKDILIPALKSIVTSVSISDGRITVRLPEGLVDDEV